MEFLERKNVRVYFAATALGNLKHRIRTECAKLDYAVIAAAARQWRRCLSACAEAGGGNL